MNEKPIYIISAYIPSDEDRVVSDILKICKISQESNYVIISIKENHGYNVGLKFPEGIFTSLEDALIRICNSHEEFYKAGKMTFQEALNKEQEYIGYLQKRLLNEPKKLKNG